MNISPEDAVKSNNLMIEAVNELETRLIDAGYDAQEVGEWMFNLNENLEGLRKSSLDLAEACNATNLDEVPAMLNGYATLVLYAIKPYYLEGYLTRLDFMLESFQLSRKRKKGNQEST